MGVCLHYSMVFLFSAAKLCTSLRTPGITFCFFPSSFSHFLQFNFQGMMLLWTDLFFYCWLDHIQLSPCCEQEAGCMVSVSQKMDRVWRGSAMTVALLSSMLPTTTGMMCIFCKLFNWPTRGAITLVGYLYLYWHCPYSMQSRICVTVGCPSVCPIDRQQQRQPAGLLLSIGVCSRYWSLAVGAMLQAPVLSSKCG